MSRALVVTVFLLLDFAISTGTADASNSIQFSLMVSSAPGLDTSITVTAVDEALKAINNNSNILPGHWLKQGVRMQPISTEVTYLITKA